MPAIIHGAPYFYGTSDPLPIAGLPAGARYRLRMRARDFALCFVKTANGISEHYLLSDGEGWTLGPAVNRNHRQ